MSDLLTKVHAYLDKLHLPAGRNRIERYGLVIVLVSFYFVVKQAMVAALGREHPFLFALFVVTISAWYGGFGPGMLAAISTGGIVYFFFLEPEFSITGEQNIINIFIIGIFFLQGFIISLLSESHRKSDIQKSEFVGIISHELKNPLTSLKGYAEILKRLAEQKHEKKMAEFSQKISNQASQLTEMINEILDITTIETGRLTYHDEPFNFTELVKESVRDQQVSTNTHKLSISGKVPIKVIGDRYRLGQVINNLLSNAIKYSPGEKRVVVTLKRLPRTIMLQVQDFGPGIDIKDQKNIFKPFYRVKKTQSAKGTGIGLFISSQIIQRHGGTIWVESTPGKGSIFCVQLPRKKV